MRGSKFSFPILACGVLTAVAQTPAGNRATPPHPPPPPAPVPYPQIRFIGFNHVMSNELLSFNGVFVGLQVGGRVYELQVVHRVVFLSATACV